MPRGEKSSHTGKQKREAEHIEEGDEDRGVSHQEAERRAWATVNEESGGGKKSVAGRGKKGWETHAVATATRETELPRSARGLMKGKMRLAQRSLRQPR